MEDSQKVAILLKEYDTLRAEAIARMNARFAFVGIATGIIALAVSRDGTASSWLLLGLAAVLMAVWFYIGQLLYRLGLGIQRVEREINKLAETELLVLVWESKNSSRFFARVHGPFARNSSESNA